MPIATPSCNVATRVVDLLAAVGISVRPATAIMRIDRDEYETIDDELIDRQARRIGDVVTVTGNHEDHGRVTLRREANVFTIEAEELGF